MSTPADSPVRVVFLAYPPLWLCLVCSLLGCGRIQEKLGELKGEAKEEEQNTAAPGVTAPPFVLAPVRVRVSAVQDGELNLEDQRSGTLTAWRSARVSAEANGRIVRRSVERGKRVRKGQLLFSIDSQNARDQERRSDLALRMRDIDAAQSERDLARAEKLARGQGITQNKLEQRRHARDSATAARRLAAQDRSTALRNLRHTRIRAPFSGIIAELNLEVGDFARVGTPAATIVDISKLRLEVGLTAAELSDLSVGEKVELELTDGVGQRPLATLEQIAPLPDRHTGLYTAEFSLTNRKDKLRPGMTGRVKLKSSSGQKGLTIPRNAVLRRGDGVAVYVIEQSEVGQTIARLQKVEVGRRGPKRVQILSGVTAAQQVVVDGHFALVDGAAVSIEGLKPVQDLRDGVGAQP